MHQDAVIASVPWYRTLSREQWRVLAASNLAWLFDGFEIYALFLTVGFALHQLLAAAQFAALPRYAGFVLATTVFGWATGGVIGGIIADYIGRKRTMMLAILAYSLTTGLSAIAWNWESFAILRFLVGVGIGSEWATGASIVSELWPDHARGKGGGLLAIGRGDRQLYRLGRVALDRRAGAQRLALDVSGRDPAGPAGAVDLAQHARNRRAGKTPTNAAARRANERRSGVALDGEAAALTRFTVTDMFLDRSIRRRLVAAFLMMLSVTFGFWGVATFIPTYVGTVAAKAGLSAPYYSAVAGLLGTGVAIFGFITLGFLSDAIGRKPTTMLYYAMCLVLTPVVYLWAQTMGALLVAVTVFGFFTGGIWAWAPVWLPELFPTRMRGTAVAFCFNAPRWISAIGPLIAGALIVALGGYGKAATIVGLFFILGVVVAPFLPETNGKPLPDIV